MPVPPSVKTAFRVAKDEVYLGDVCGAPSGSDADYTVNGVTRKGTAWLFSTRLCVQLQDGKVMTILLKDLVGMQQIQRIGFQGKSFSQMPEKEQTLELRTAAANHNTSPVKGGLAGGATGVTVHTLRLSAVHGVPVGRAIDFLWRYIDNRLSSREAVYLACSSLEDVVSAVVCVPMALPSALIQSGHRNEGMLRLSLEQEDPKLTLETPGGAKVYSCRLDDVASLVIEESKGVGGVGAAETLILGVRERGGKGPLEEVCFRERSINKNALSNALFVGTFKQLQRVWAVNCNSLVTLSVHHAVEAGKASEEDLDAATQRELAQARSKVLLGDHSGLDEIELLPDDACLDLDQVMRLLATFQVMDSNHDGRIGEEEFVQHLGPAVRKEVSRAVFRVFDIANDRAISFPEYLFGHRILRLGSRQDRMRYFYRIFDVSGKSCVRYQDFLDIMRLLRDIAPEMKMAVPPEYATALPTPFDAWCLQLFDAIADKNQVVAIADFKLAMQHNPDFRSAIAWAFEEGVDPDDECSDDADGGVDPTAEPAPALRRKNLKKLVSFGSPDWLMATSILAGIQKAIDHRSTLPQRPKGKKRRRGASAVIKKATSSLQRSFSSKPEVRDDSSDGINAVPVMKESEWPHFPHKLYEDSKVVWNLSTGEQVPHFPPPQKPPKFNGVCTPGNCTVYFADYCPEVFDEIMDMTGMTKKVYLQSLGITQLQGAMLSGAMTSLVAMSSSSQSGSFFYLSHDQRFLLKTIPQGEYETFRRILRDYHRHLRKYPRSLLSRILGLHRMQFGDQKVIFIVMENVLHSSRTIDVTYDLKGSEIGRQTHPDKKHLGMALKDVDLKDDRGGVISMPPGAVAQLTHMLAADSELLRDRNIIDYSVLLGIHRCRDDDEGDASPSAHIRSVKGYDVDASDPLRNFCGGCRSSDGKEVYYLGIIDILTDYGVRKLAERSSKALIYITNPDGISCVGPRKYQKRFIDAMQSTFLPRAVTYTEQPPRRPGDAPGAGKDARRTHPRGGAAGGPGAPLGSTPPSSPFPSRLRKGGAGGARGGSGGPGGPASPGTTPGAEPPHLHPVTSAGTTPSGRPPSQVSPTTAPSVSFSPLPPQAEADIAGGQAEGGDPDHGEHGTPTEPSTSPMQNFADTSARDASEFGEMTESVPQSPCSPLPGVIRTRTYDMGSMRGARMASQPVSSPPRSPPQRSSLRTTNQQHYGHSGNGCTHPAFEVCDSSPESSPRRGVCETPPSAHSTPWAQPTPVTHEAPPPPPLQPPAAMAAPAAIPGGYVEVTPIPAPARTNPLAARAAAPTPRAIHVRRAPHEQWGVQLLLADDPRSGVWVVGAKPGSAFDRTGVPKGQLVAVNNRPVTHDDHDWVLPELAALAARGVEGVTVSVKPAGGQAAAPSPTTGYRPSPTPLATSAVVSTPVASPMAIPTAAPAAAPSPGAPSDVLASALPGYAVVEDGDADVGSGPQGRGAPVHTRYPSASLGACAASSACGSQRVRGGPWHDGVSPTAAVPQGPAPRVAGRLPPPAQPKPLPTAASVTYAAPFARAGGGAVVPRPPPARGADDVVDELARRNAAWGGYPTPHARNGDGGGEALALPPTARMYTVGREDPTERWGVLIERDVAGPGGAARRTPAPLMVVDCRPAGAFARAGVTPGVLLALNGRRVARGDDEWVLEDLMALQRSGVGYLTVTVDPAAGTTDRSGSATAALAPPAPSYQAPPTLLPHALALAHSHSPPPRAAGGARHWASPGGASAAAHPQYQYPQQAFSDVPSEGRGPSAYAAPSSARAGAYPLQL